MIVVFGCDKIIETTTPHDFYFMTLTTLNIFKSAIQLTYELFTEGDGGDTCICRGPCPAKDEDRVDEVLVYLAMIAIPSSVKSHAVNEVGDPSDEFGDSFEGKLRVIIGEYRLGHVHNE